MKTGIEYQLTGDRNRSRVVGYHRGPSPRNLQVGAKNLDIAHLPKRKQTQLLTKITLKIIYPHLNVN